MKRYLVELIGTFFLVLAISVTGNPWAVGPMLMAMVYLGYHISGAHYNPAVTLAVYLRGKLAVQHVGYYMLAQIAGALLASVLYNLVYGTVFIQELAPEASMWVVMLLEVLLTFVWCSVVLAVSTTSALRGNYIYGVAIGITLMGIAFFAGSYNPAVALGSVLFSLVRTGSLGGLNALAVYTVGPLIGGVLSGYLCNYLYSEETF